MCPIQKACFQQLFIVGFEEYILFLEIVSDLSFAKWNDSYVFQAIIYHGQRHQ